MSGTSAPEPSPGGRPDEELELRATADGSLTLYDPSAQQTYHSDHGAIAEARHVYLGASGAARRLAAGGELHVLEVGLGTGLNLLLTLDAARSGGAGLHYRALERRPPTPEQVRSLRLGRFLDHPELVEAWLEILVELRGRGARREPSALPETSAHHETGPGRAGRALASYELPGGALLDVALGDATTGATTGATANAAAGTASGTERGAEGHLTDAAAAAMTPGWADVVYHDAFSPSASPELWSEAFLTACASAMAPGGTWVSYTVAGAVRRRLQAAGLEPVKLAGPPGGKREMCRAIKPRESGSDPTA